MLQAVMTTKILIDNNHIYDMMLFMNIEHAINVALDPSSPKLEGSAAVFIRLNNSYGLKYYESAWVRDDAHLKQDIAAKNNFAPPVGEKFEFLLPNKQRFYGFITGTVVETSIEYFQGMLRIRPGEMSVLNNLNNAILKRVNELKDATGLVMHDNHIGNNGLSPDGNIWFIDFDFCDLK